MLRFAAGQRLGKLSSQVQHFVDKLNWRKIIKTLSRSVIYQLQNSIQLLVSNFGKVSSSREEETEQSVDVLVTATLPGGMCISKINLYIQSLFLIFEAKEFGSII